MSQQTMNLQQFLTCKQKLGKKSKQPPETYSKQNTPKASSDVHSRQIYAANGVPASTMRFSSPKMLSLLNTPLSQQKLIFNLK